MELKFPVSVAKLEEALPHRFPMLWIDEVLWIKDNEGVSRVRLQEQGHYFDEKGTLRASSFIEWMAQGYGFVKACMLLAHPHGVKKYNKTYLAAFSQVVIESNAQEHLNSASEVLVHVRIIRELGPLTLIEGRVSVGDLTLATAQLKIYCA